MEPAITLTIEQKFSPFYAKINAIINDPVVTVKAQRDKLKIKNGAVKMLKTDNFKLNEELQI